MLKTTVSPDENCWQAAAMGGEGGDAGFEFGINPNDDPEPGVSGGFACIHKYVHMYIYTYLLT